MNRRRGLPIDRFVRHRGILTALFESPGRNATIRELAALARTPYATTWRVVQDLSALGALHRQRVGHSELVSVNERSPLIESLKRVLAVQLSPHRQVAQRFADAASRVPAVRKIILFGSVARGEETVGSDVDVAVVLVRKTEAAWADIIRCASDVGDETGLTVVPIRMTVREIARGGSFPRTLAAGEVLYERH